MLDIAFHQKQHKGPQVVNNIPASWEEKQVFDPLCVLHSWYNSVLCAQGTLCAPYIPSKNLMGKFFLSHYLQIYTIENSLLAK